MFKVQYYKQNNSGKPAAINLGVTKAVGDYIFIVDSDDALTLNAIGTIYDCIVKYTVASDFEFSGLGFRKSFFDGKCSANILSGILIHLCCYIAQIVIIYLKSI
ncbi:glycosyltransferase [Escherichia coli]